jgi:hypothetical protein
MRFAIQKDKLAGDLVQVVQCLPSKPKTLNLNSNTAKGGKKDLPTSTKRILQSLCFPPTLGMCYFSFWTCKA